MSQNFASLAIRQSTTTDESNPLTRVHNTRLAASGSPLATPWAKTSAVSLLVVVAQAAGTSKMEDAPNSACLLDIRVVIGTKSSVICVSYSCTTSASVKNVGALIFRAAKRDFFTNDQGH
jgi:hypothetical protein